MNDLIRLCYISRSNQMEKGDKHLKAINQQVLSEAQSFNQINNITGILCSGNGYYLQVIEGNKSAIELLYTKIEKDPRHEDVKLIFKEPVTSRAFEGWQMKLVDDISYTMPLVRMHGHKHFSPFEFAENLFKDIIDFLSQHCATNKINK